MLKEEKKQINCSGYLLNWSEKDCFVLLVGEYQQEFFYDGIWELTLYFQEKQTTCAVQVVGHIWQDLHFGLGLMFKKNRLGDESFSYFLESINNMGLKPNALF
jgi:hypothetical protein